MPQFHAYLILIIDTRPPDGDLGMAKTLTEYRRLTIDIFGESTPTLPGHAHSIVMITASGPDFDECRRALLAMVDDPSPLNVFGWTRPLLSERARS